MKLFIRIKYIGTAFSGYQVQHGRRTVQGELCRACAELFGHACDVTGCSRTDAGVHAECFCAAVSDKGGDRLTTSIPVHRIPEALNAHLPGDISVFYAACVDGSFHPRYGVKEKTYVYRIINTQFRDPFYEGRAWFIPGTVFDAGDIEKMNRAAAKLIGTHDFTSFCGNKKMKKTAVRTIYEINFTKKGNDLWIDYRGNGFLQNMVRILTGTLIEVGDGRRAPEELPQILESKNRESAGYTAPACGLMLMEVHY